MSAKRARRVEAEAYDLGPRHQHAIGRLQVVEVADPDRPYVRGATIRRSRAVWVPDVLLESGALDLCHHTAAKQLLDDFETANQDGGTRPLIYVQTSAKPGGITDHALDAQTRYRLAMQAIGMRASPLVVDCVLTYGSLTAVAAKRGCTVHQIKGELRSTLDRLCDHYGL